SGPIGSVITPQMQGVNDWKHLSYASSLCGNCTEVCPIKINIHELLLENRIESVENGAAGWQEQLAWKAWKSASLHRNLLNRRTQRIENWLINEMVKGSTKHRADLNFREKTFNELWREKTGPSRRAGCGVGAHGRRPRKATGTSRTEIYI